MKKKSEEEVERRVRRIILAPKIVSLFRLFAHSLVLIPCTQSAGIHLLLPHSAAQVSILKELCRERISVLRFALPLFSASSSSSEQLCAAQPAS